MRRTGSCSIGIVDDDREIVRTYEKLFERHRISVSLIAYDGGEAVRMFYALKSKPSVIIMDERMPSMNGTDATIELVKCDPKPSIIFVTADQGSMAEAFKAGAKIFLKKPASLKTILEAVKLVHKNCTTHKYYYDMYKGFVANTSN